jgi:soluble lytic murein transglycosylase-like protein
VTDTCELAPCAGGIGAVRPIVPVRKAAGLTLALTLVGLAPAAWAQAIETGIPQVPLATGHPLSGNAVCPVTGTLRITDEGMLKRFQALQNCEAQTVRGVVPTRTTPAAPVALEGKGEGAAEPEDAEKGGAVEVQGRPAADPAATAMLAPAAAGLAQLAAAPDMIVRLRPVHAEIDLAATEAAALEDTSILALAPRSYATRHDQLIAATARRHRIDPLLLHAMVRQESNYGAGARSPAGAIGLMQIMPATGARFGHAAAVLADPAINLDAGARLLRALHTRYGNNLDLILAAYNAGEGAVARYGNTIPPFRETRDYVRLVKGHYAALAAQNGHPAATRF